MSEHLKLIEKLFHLQTNEESNTAAVTLCRGEVCLLVQREAFHSDNAPRFVLHSILTETDREAHRGRGLVRSAARKATTIATTLVSAGGGLGSVSPATFPFST